MNTYSDLKAYLLETHEDHELTPETKEYVSMRQLHEKDLPYQFSLLDIHYPAYYKTHTDATLYLFQNRHCYKALHNWHVGL